MNKELEALDYVWDNYYTEEMDYETHDNIENNLDTIKQALQRLKAIDNANLSEALECLEKLQSNIRPLNDYYYSDEQRKCYETIKQALIKAQEQEKVLKIIKEKEVNIQVFNQCEDVETYNNVYKKQKDRQLTQEEFDLLKRWT